MVSHRCSVLDGAAVIRFAESLFVVFFRFHGRSGLSRLMLSTVVHVSAPFHQQVPWLAGCRQHSPLPFAFRRPFATASNFEA
jgi:hypothetical protein